MHAYKEWRTKTGRYAVCACDGLHYPHRPGSSVWCVESETTPSEADFISRYGNF